MENAEPQVNKAHQSKLVAPGFKKDKNEANPESSEAKPKATLTAPLKRKLEVKRVIAPLKAAANPVTRSKGLSGCCVFRVELNHIIIS
jgi:hypothetical protein